MKNIVKLDVLVVYSASVAQSASVSDSQSIHPFLINSRRSNYNLSYAYFLDTCQKNGLTAGFTTSADIVGPGQCQNYWTSDQGNWTKINGMAKSTQIFDKISPRSSLRLAERKLLLSHQSIIPFNDPTLFSTFYDKLLTYQLLAPFSIPTTAVLSARVKDITQALSQLRQLVKQHPFSTDFSSALVLKDRFGAGGNHVYKIARNFSHRIQNLMSKNPEVQFVLQPFLAFDHGYTYQNRHAPTDLRLIFHSNQLLQSYIRIAQPRDFRCNEHQGGELIYVEPSAIPASVHTIASQIVRQLNLPDSLYALDFLVSNSGHVYFVEGNTGPGLDWDITKKLNEQKSKQLIRSIVSRFTTRLTA